MCKCLGDFFNFRLTTVRIKCVFPIYSSSRSSVKPSSANRSLVDFYATFSVVYCFHSNGTNCKSTTKEMNHNVIE